MFPLRGLAGLAAALALIGASALPGPYGLRFDSSIAHAQSRAKAKKEPPAGKQQPQGPAARTAFTADEQAVAVIPGIPEARVWGDSAAEFKRVLPTVRGPWLAMSGGGADGAFAAGVLAGWSQSGKRPEFAVVTGASIGALISPYAFLGPRYDAELKDAITTINAAEIFEDRPTRESFFDDWPLKQLIEKRVTAQLMAEVAAEHRRGRRLLAVTTNVDAGRRVIWNMGAIAEAGGEKGLKLFRDVLLASSSIPGFFPPVMIDVEANGRRFQEMHLDGTITSPFFVAPEDYFADDSNGPLPASKLYIIANSRLTPDFEVPERSTVSILGRLISVVLKAELRGELLLVASNAQRFGVEIGVATVSPDFQKPARGFFDHPYMQALFDHGFQRGSQGTAFETLSSASADQLGPDRSGVTGSADQPRQR
ncbi:MAG TPA: patatin-like phospholipase family protein [Xanthobacteraceae bacterium]